MNRRGIIVLSMLLLVAVSAGLKVLHNSREEARRTRARAEMEEFRKAIAIRRSMNTHEFDGPEDSRQMFPFTHVDADAFFDTNPDPWGHEHIFEVAGHSLTITCLGADDELGGEGADEDIVLHWPAPKDPSPR